MCSGQTGLIIEVEPHHLSAEGTCHQVECLALAQQPQLPMHQNQHLRNKAAILLVIQYYWIPVWFTRGSRKTHTSLLCGGLFLYRVQTCGSLVVTSDLASFPGRRRNGLGTRLPQILRLFNS